MGQYLNAAVIVVYLLLMLFLGLWATRKAKNADDYRVAGRRLGMLMYTGTMSAVVIGGSATVGGVALGYRFGISALWMVTAIAAGLLILSLFIAGPVRRAKVYTINQVLDLRFGDGVSSKVSSLITVLYTLTLAVNSTSVYATIFAVMFPGMSKQWAVILGGTIVVVYSVFGGMWSITLTDMMQFIFMTVGMFFILLPFSIYHTGGLANMIESLPREFFKITNIGGSTIFTYFVLFTLGMLIGQDIWQRVFTSRDEKVAKWGGVSSSIYVFLYAIAGAIIGMAGKAIDPPGVEEKAGNLFAILATGYVPQVLGGIALAAAVAAMMSTASGTLIAAATVTRVDLAPVVMGWFGKKSVEVAPGEVSSEVDQKSVVWTDRIFVLVFGVIVTFLATFLNDPVMGMVIGYDILVGGMFIPVLGALAWKRANGIGAVLGMVAGTIATVVGLLIYGGDANEPIYLGMAASLVFFVATSLLTKPTDPSVMQAWQERMAQRKVASTKEPAEN